MNLNPIKLTTKEQVERFFKAIEESEKVPKKEAKINYKILRGQELKNFLERVK